ncbi:RHS repeat domain-containing protein [uncultured Microscilla sp.]|uniref:RHS repeat domain-containing protein n=1 Tax=uncultured Microscilla sp. TaxID=432653 RepID=UPI002637DCDD|nr:RHS repeat domain-containing protein [uncultured Microscilla sp.]
MRKNTVLLLFAFFCVNLCCIKPVRGQTSNANIQSLIPASAEASGFGKYVDVPVSAYTGTPGVAVPIVNVRGKTLTLPVSLSYHHKGLQVEGQSGRVGLGWNLSAGGMITRVVRGEVDEKSGMTRYDQVADIQNTITQEFFGKIDQGFQDGAPDVYTFNFLGQSGRFILYQNKAYFFSHSRLKVTHFSGSNLFTIIGEDGTTYTFDAAERVNHIFGNIPNINTSDYISSWHLTQVISANKKDTITLRYNAVATTISKSIASYRYALGACSKNNASVHTPSETNINGQELAAIESSLMKVVFKTDSQVRLDVANRKALKTIEVYDKQDLNHPIKTIQLEQGYFGNNVHLKLNKVTAYDKNLQPKPSYVFEYHEELPVPDRASKSQDHWGFYNGAQNTTLIPKLTSGQPYGNANRNPDFEATRTTVLKKMIYPTGGHTVFEYEQNHYENIPSNSVALKNQQASASVAPPVSNVNLTTRSVSLTIDYQQVVTLQHNVKRYRATSGLKDNINDIELKNAQGEVIWYIYTTYNAQAEQGITGTMQKELPAGNYTLVVNAEGGDDIVASVNYKSYDYKVITRKTGPGLRIKRITAYDRLKTTPAKVQTYLYEGGVLQIPTQNYASNVEVSVLEAKGSNPTNISDYDCITCNYTYIGTSPQDFRYFSPYSHYALVYTKVTELIGDNGAGGKNITYYEIPNQEDFNNVTVKEQKQLAFMPATNTFRLVNEVAYQYQEVTDRTFWAIIIRVLSTNQCNLGGNNLKDYFRESYTLPMRWRYLTQVTEKSYDDRNQVMINTTHTSYSSIHRYPNEVISVNSEGEKLIHRKKYPEDYTHAIAGFLVDKHILAVVLEEQVWQEKAGVQTLLSGKVIAIDPLVLQPKKVYSLETNEALTSLNQATQTGPLYNTLLSDSHYKLAATFGFDSEGNIHLQQKNNDLSIAYLWGYHHHYPIARAINALPQQIFHTSFEDLEPSSHLVATQAYTGNKSWQGSYRIPVGQKPAAGNYLLTYWERVNGKWVFRQKKLSYDPNTNPTLVNTTHLIDEVRMYPEDAQMYTYTYHPIYGMTSGTDANGRAIHYVYDAWGRLTLVKDHEQNIIKKYTYTYQQD